MTIHRIVPGFVFQGGDRNGNGTGGPGYSVDEEPPKDLELRRRASWRWRRAATTAGTSGSQFFVVTGADAASCRPTTRCSARSPAGSRWSTKIGAIVTDPRTDRPEAPVVIESIRVSER